jgi:hypothetical protein
MADTFSLPIYLALLVRAGLLVRQTLGVIGRNGADDDGGGQ